MRTGDYHDVALRQSGPGRVEEDTDECTNLGRKQSYLLRKAVAECKDLQPASLDSRLHGQSRSGHLLKLQHYSRA